MGERQASTGAPRRRSAPWGVFLLVLAGLVVACGEDQQVPEEFLQGLRVELPGRPVDLQKMDLPLEELDSQGQPTQHLVLGQAMEEHEVVLLNFWATWCGPCLDELPSLVHLGGRFLGRDLRILAVSYDDDWAAQERAWLQRLGGAKPPIVRWLRDPAGRGGGAQGMMRMRLGTEKLPETWVICGGVLVARFVGPQDWSDPRVIRYFYALTGGDR